MNSKGFSVEYSKKNKKGYLKNIKDDQDRITILKDMLPVFCSTDAQL